MLIPIWLLHRVDVGDVANLSKVHAASIFRVEVCKLGEFLCIYGILFQEIRAEAGWGWPSSVPTEICLLRRFADLLHLMLSRIGACDYRWGLEWWMDLLTTCTHHSELQVITAPLLISTIHKSPLHPLNLFPACSVNSRSLATSSNSGDSSASLAHVVTLRRISRNWTLVKCQLNYSAISS
jgi:hypothetical protein